MEMIDFPAHAVIERKTKVNSRSSSDYPLAIVSQAERVNVMWRLPGGRGGFHQMSVEYSTLHSRVGYWRSHSVQTYWLLSAASIPVHCQWRCAGCSGAAAKRARSASINAHPRLGRAPRWRRRRGQILCLKFGIKQSPRWPL